MSSSDSYFMTSSLLTDLFSFFRVFSFLDIVALCRCAQVSKVHFRLYSHIVITDFNQNILLKCPFNLNLSLPEGPRRYEKSYVVILCLRFHPHICFTLIPFWLFLDWPLLGLLLSWWG